MQAETAGHWIERVHAIEAEVAALRRTIQDELLDVSAHQYLSRCFDLLNMELDAVRQYIEALR